MQVGSANSQSGLTGFHWAAQAQQNMAQSPMGGVAAMQQMLGQFGDLNASMSPWAATTTVGDAALPDFSNSGHLAVDKAKGTVSTPGGYEISVKEGKVRIKTPEGKWTQLKAEPPNRTLVNTTDDVETRQQATVERQLARDPVVRESDGDVWRYQGTGSFHLPDGTKITIHEKGAGKDLHIDQVDIYNGNKHVGVKSQLTASEWQTVDRKVERSVGDWRTTSSNRRTEWRGRRGQVIRTDNQARTIRTTTTETQQAAQQFRTTFTDVTRDGFAHDMRTDDGKTFRISGDGDDWAENGREVMSGAGKGKDDKTLAYKLGDKIDPNWAGLERVCLWYDHAHPEHDDHSVESKSRALRAAWAAVRQQHDSWALGYDHDGHQYGRLQRHLWRTGWRRSTLRCRLQRRLQRRSTNRRHAEFGHGNARRLWSTRQLE